MDTALHLIQSGRAHEGTDRLVRMLAGQWLGLGANDWKRFASHALAHPIREYMHADPFTFRAFSKPRGYAGDAVMMDYIYGHRQEQLETPADEVFRYTTQHAPAPEGVRERRRVLARTIDAVADTAGRPIEVTAIAAGHLREMELSVAAAQGRARVTAIDADEQSLDVVSRAYAHLGAATVHGSVRQILSGKLQLEPVDLVYSAGLYDYLSKPVAERLTSTMFAALRPHGTLLLANFLPDIPDVGYMESFMDWHLIYRTDQDMLDLIDALPRADVACVRQFRDSQNTITFLEVTKRP